MKVRVKGLVFVGFAAAVFAQNAMATGDNDARTVTSKLYVDQKVEGATGNGDTVPYATTINENSPNDKAPSSQNVYKFVTGAVGSLSVSGDEYIDASTTNGATSISLDTNNLAKTEASITDNTGSSSGVPAAQDKLVTASAVKGYAQPKIADEKQDKIMFGRQTKTGSGANAVYTNGWGELVVGDVASGSHVTSTNYVAKEETSTGVYSIDLDAGQIANWGVETTGTNAHGNDIASGSSKLATANAVYEFVTDQNKQWQPKVTDNTDSLKVGYLGTAANATATWKTLKVPTATTLSSTAYVARKADANGDYDINIDSDQIAASGDFVASGATNASTKRPKLATAGTVYDFVNETSQRRLADNATESNNVMIGFKSYANSAYGASEWKQLKGDSTYITVAIDSTDSNNGKIALTNLTSATSDFDATNNRTKLARSGDVYDFVIGQTGGNVIPAMSADCISAINGTTPNNHCALVASWDATLNSNAGGIVLEWTVIAQP